MRHLDQHPDDALLHALPKVELHVHLEGSVRPATLLRIARRHGLDLGGADERRLARWFAYRDFQHFTEVFEQATAALREPEDLAAITVDLGRAAYAQRVRYLEVTFTPGMHQRGRGIPFDEQMNAIAEAAVRIQQENGVRMRFVVDHVRGESPTECLRTAEWAVAGRDHGVVALGLGGYEPGRPSSLFGEAIGFARDHGVPFVPHAGEAVGPEAIWDAMAFDPPRIGHGVHALQDAALAALLRERGVVLELCPTSNLRTGVVAAASEHPLRRLWDAGIRVCLNSDDPAMFQTDVATEYRFAARWHGFTVAELAAMTLDAVDAALLPAPDRADLRAAVTADLDALGVRPAQPPSALSARRSTAM
ncbi:adenosine deaminase [Micromonospora sp. NPDC003776]